MRIQNHLLQQRFQGIYYTNNPSKGAFNRLLKIAQRQDPSLKEGQYIRLRIETPFGERGALVSGSEFQHIKNALDIIQHYAKESYSRLKLRDLTDKLKLQIAEVGGNLKTQKHSFRMSIGRGLSVSDAVMRTYPQNKIWFN